MRKVSFALLVLSILFVLFGLSIKKADAIPAFARKYKTTCITCHATYPRLTAFGEAFRLNGYKMPGGDELYIKDEPVSMGAEAYKKVFPDAVWPSDIPGMPPIALRIISDYNIDIGGTEESRTEFEFPHEAEVLVAGSFGDRASFFVEFEFEEAELELEVETEPVGSGGEDVVTEVEVEEFESGTEFEAWIMFEDLFRETLGENHLNIQLGSVGMQTIDLPNSRSHNRITAQRYLYSEEFALHPKPGVELNGFDKNWRYALGVVDGDRATSEKDYYGQLAFKIGGLGYDGVGGFTEEGGLKSDPAGYWRDDAILFGFFGFLRKLGPNDDDFNTFGVDVRWNYKDISLAGGYVVGDTDIGADRDIFFAEAEYFVFPWLQPYVRYETLDSDAVNGDKARFIVGSVWLARANVRFLTEGRFYTDNEPVESVTGDKNDEDRIVFRIDYAF